MCIHVEPTSEGSSKSVALRHNVCVCVCVCVFVCARTCMAVSKIIPYPYVTRLLILNK